MSIVLFTSIVGTARPEDLRPIATAPCDGTVIRGFIHDEGLLASPLVEARVKWRNDDRGDGWVLADDPDAFVFEPEGWLPA